MNAMKKPLVAIKYAIIQMAVTHVAVYLDINLNMTTCFVLTLMNVQ